MLVLIRIVVIKHIFHKYLTRQVGKGCVEMIMLFDKAQQRMSKRLKYVKTGKYIQLPDSLICFLSELGMSQWAISFNSVTF